MRYRGFYFMVAVVAITHSAYAETDFHSSEGLIAAPAWYPDDDDDTNTGVLPEDTEVNTEAPSPKNNTQPAQKTPQGNGSMQQHGKGQMHQESCPKQNENCPRRKDPNEKPAKQSQQNRSNGKQSSTKSSSPAEKTQRS